jgi:N-acetylmuramoyl-L-alanine amidase
MIPDKAEIIGTLRGTISVFVVLLVVAAGSIISHLPGALSPLLYAQGTAPQAPLTLITRDARRPIPTTMVGGQELIALDEVAMLFQATMREDPLTGVTLTYRGRTIVISPDQPMASVNGRVVTMPTAVVRSGSRWLVPVEFISRALAPVYDQRIELRRTQRLLLVGDVRVPRVVARVENAGAGTRVAIDVTPAANVTVAADQGRVLVRIDADYLDTTLPASGGGLVEQVRRGDAANTIAVVLAPSAGTPRVTQSTADGTAHVTIDIAPATPPATPTETAAPRPPSPAPEATITASRPAFPTIVIDPGHGGDDRGATGPGGLQEKAFSLDVARRLRGLIETRLGFRVILTRDDDRNVALDARAAIANNSKADMFLSLHVNAAPSPSMAGAEVFHLELDRVGEEIRRQSAADAVTLPVVSGGTRRLDVIRWDMAQARHIDESARLAGIIAEQLGTQRITVSPRGVQRAPLRVLEGADTPAALVELFYVSNPAQEKAAATEDFKNGLAQALFDSIVRFRGAGDEADGR